MAQESENACTFILHRRDWMHAAYVTSFRQPRYIIRTIVIAVITLIAWIDLNANFSTEVNLLTKQGTNMIVDFTIVVIGVVALLSCLWRMYRYYWRDFLFEAQILTNGLPVNWSSPGIYHRPLSVIVRGEAEDNNAPKKLIFEFRPWGVYGNHPCARIEVSIDATSSKQLSYVMTNKFMIITMSGKGSTWQNSWYQPLIASNGLMDENRSLMGQRVNSAPFVVIKLSGTNANVYIDTVRKLLD